MKKIKEIFKNNLKIVIAFILGIIISGTTVYAATIIYNANQVGFNNSNTSLSSTDVQGALDELYTRASNCKKAPNNTVYYAFGDPTTSSTTNYSTLNRKIFIARNGDQRSVCVIRSNRLHCFDNNNYAIEKDHLAQVFSDVSCNIYNNSGYSCSANDFWCIAYYNGNTWCRTINSTRQDCEVYANGNGSCWT